MNQKEADVVAIRQNRHCTYPTRAPFDPPEIFDELAGYVDEAVDQSNQVYSMVRNSLIDCELDKNNIGTSEWSPFASLLKKGSTVVIKPNLVLNTPDISIQNTVVTHASVIRPIIDYCWKAVGPSGRIIIGDAPQAEADFNEIISRNGLKDTVNILKERGVRVELKDFRCIRVLMENGIWVGEQQNSDYSADDSVIVSLNEKSLFYDKDDKEIRYHGGGYDSSITKAHHHGSVHEYKVAKDVLIADAVISIPKLKTHKKAGITCCLKNLVGINVDKNFLPHFIIGPQNLGGDETPEVYGWRKHLMCVNRKIRDALLDHHWKFWGKIISKSLSIIYKTGKEDTQKNLASKFFSQTSGTPVFQGAWPGNTTICKMILDLNRVFLYANHHGEICDGIQRKVLYIVDGISIGQHNGPMEPSTVYGGIIAAGTNAFHTDVELLKKISINPFNIPLYSFAAKNKTWLAMTDEVIVKVNGERADEEDKLLTEIVPPDNWTF